MLLNGKEKVEFMYRVYFTMNRLKDLMFNGEKLFNIETLNY